MALHVTEIRDIHFSKYDQRYADFYVAVTNARNIVPTLIRLEYEGVQNPEIVPELQWSRISMFYKAHLLGNTENVEHTINTPSDAVKKRFLEIFEGVETNKDMRSLMSMLERKVTWSEDYASHDHASQSEQLSLDIFLRIAFYVQQPRKRWFTVKLWKSDGVQKDYFATIKNGENVKEELFDISDVIRHKTIGAVKGFLPADINALYLLEHEVPREVYHYLDELARIRKE